MTVSELKEILEEYEESGHGEMTVRIARQPSWPLAGNVHTTCRIGNTFWIASEEARGYAPRAAWNGEDLDEDTEI